MMNLKKTVEQLRKQLHQRLTQRAFIENRIADLNIALRSLARSLEKDEREELLAELAQVRRKPAGLTETVLECLSKSPYQSFSASEIRTWLEREGCDLSEYSQPVATISITLRRLAESGRAELVREGRNVRYRWKQPPGQPEENRSTGPRGESRYAKEKDNT